MASIQILLFTAILALSLSAVQGHGRLTEPPHRGWAWRLGFNTPPDYTDNENFCGGVGVQYQKNNGKCGACGDNFALQPPRPNENGGTYGIGTIVKTYKAGSQIEVNVQLTASHMGYFEFAICPLNSSTDVETEECFDNHKLELATGGTKYTNVDAPRHYKIKLVLPKSLTCEHCTLRWHYRTGNSWGNCGDGTGALGCGNQEIFRSCADIKIV